MLKNTPEDSSDKTMIPKAVSMIRELLSKLNQETGKTENRFNLAQLENQLYFKPGDEVVCTYDYSFTNYFPPRFAFIVVESFFLIFGSCDLFPLLGFEIEGAWKRDYYERDAVETRWRDIGAFV